MKHLESLIFRLSKYWFVCFQLHPDINKKDPKTHEKFVKLNEAYNVLKKPIDRREYDLNLAVRLQMEQQARYASQSHVYGSSAWPGSGTSSDRQWELV